MNLAIELTDLQFAAIEREAHRANTIPNELIGWALIRLCWEIHEREAIARGDEPDGRRPETDAAFMARAEAFERDNVRRGKL